MKMAFQDEWSHKTGSSVNNTNTNLLNIYEANLERLKCQSAGLIVAWRSYCIHDSTCSLIADGKYGGQILKHIDYNTPRF